MKQVNIYPDYYREFHCIADKCPDNCCEEWEIVVDDESAGIYESITGAIGEKLHSSMTIDADGDRIFRLEKNRCSFLEETGFCEIHRILGEGFLCKTCREYPRAVQDSGDFAEHDLSLSCPEAARIILSKTQRPEYIKSECEIDNEEICYDTEFMRFMKSSRREMIDIIWDKSFSVDEAVDKCIRYANQVQQYIDDIDGEIISETFAFNTGVISFTEIIDDYLSGDILTYEFRENLMDARLLGDKPMDSPEFSEDVKKLDVYDISYRQLCTYYINRYWLRAAFDYDAEEKIIIMAKAYALVRRICLAYVQKNKELPFSAFLRIVQLYSKETEHNTDI